VVFLFAYPETSADNILRRRAQRLRKLTGRSNIKSKSEIDQEHLKASEVFIDAIIKPIEIMVKDPAVAFTNIYVSGFHPITARIIISNEISFRLCD
jgi:DHA1 family multidrug resistance protein-like MFS transporter